MTGVVAVAGPTATGKTALAIALAERLDTEIISADSQQFYRGMEIGTAAPTPEERARAPHHFVCFLDPSEQMAAGDYQRAARAVVARLNAAGKPAVVVGGSGLYIHALIDGLFEGPPRDPEIRARLEAQADCHGNAHLFARLQAVDPTYAATLTSANDRVRVVRALEVHELTGTPLSELHREHRRKTRAIPNVQVALDMPRDGLYARINRRVDAQIAAGWIEETRALLDAGHGEHLQRLKSHGYRELAHHLETGAPLDETCAQIKRNVRHYAKRQFSWFRADKRIHWLDAGHGVPLAEHVAAVLRLIEQGEETPDLVPPPHVSPPDLR